MSSPRLVLVLLLALAPVPVLAADFDDGPPPPPFRDGLHRPPPPPEFESERGPRFGPDRAWARPDGCRSFVRRRLDPDGEPVLRRVRICDEPDRFDGPPRGRFDAFGPPGPPPGPWARRW